MVDEASAQSARRARQDAINAARMRGIRPDADLPPPPYHVHGVTMLYLMCRFDPEVIARIVPPGLTPSGSGWGVIGLYEAAQGWGIAPFSAFFMTAELAGVDSSDGSPGNYMHCGLFSGVAGQVMTGLYNTNFRTGWSRQRVEGDRVRGEAGIGDRTLVRVEARIAAAPTTSQSGVSRYVGRRPGGGFNSYSVAFSLELRDTSDQQVEFLDGAGEILNALEPLEYVWPVYMPRLDMAFTPPRLLADGDDSTDEARMADLAGLFNRFGRPAAILAEDGTILSLNREAHLLMTEGRLPIVNGRFSGRHDDLRAFEAALAAALGKGAEPVSERLALPAANGGLPLLAQVIALDAGTAGPGRSLVTFDDPAPHLTADPGPALRLLGLTAAEARIAGLVGGGRSPREAADELVLSLNTVRSALKIVFDKLGVSRQSELAKIVARLAS